MKLYQFFEQNTPEYVILHAQARAKRGKRPSVSFPGINNPREALKYARATLFQNGAWVILSNQVQFLTADVMMRINEALGLRFLTIEELRKFKKEDDDPLDSFRRVPLIEWDENRVNLDWLGQKEKDTWGVRTRRIFLASF